MQRKISSKRKWGVGLTAALIIGTSITFFRAKDSESRLPGSENGVFGGAIVIDKELLAAQLGPSVVSNQFPEMIDLSLDGGTRRAHIEYALDPESQERMEKIIGQYKPDYAPARAKLEQLKNIHTANVEQEPQDVAIAKQL